MVSSHHILVSLPTDDIANESTSMNYGFHGGVDGRIGGAIIALPHSVFGEFLPSFVGRVPPAEIRTKSVQPTPDPDIHRSTSQFPVTTS